MNTVVGVGAGVIRSAAALARIRPVIVLAAHDDDVAVTLHDQLITIARLSGVDAVIAAERTG